MIDLEKASREELLQLIAQLLAQQQLLQERVKQLEAELQSSRGGKGPSPSPPDWIKPSRPSRKKKKRKPRPHGFARKLDQVTARLEHALQDCPECQVALTGHRVIKRRQIIELPPVQAQVIEHQVVQRTCPPCQKPWVPDVDLAALAVGKQRFGISVQAEVGLRRQQYRLPFRVIRDYLKHRFGLRVSVGQVVALVQGVAERGKALVEEFKQQIRGSAVVNGDETGWRENGQNGHVWSFSTERLRYFVYDKSRAGRVVKEVIGEEFDGALVSDFYGGYNLHLGLHQRCWVHLLRDIHELKEKHPKDQGLRKWAAKVKAIYERAKGYQGPSAKLAPSEQQAERVRRQREFEQELLKVCRVQLKKKRVQSRLCERVERFLAELFVFVADPRVARR